ncbi:MAG: DUF3108 domain-containing protein [Bacteroidales bacterium]|nr:DUF3108 domain-containing protein [Bacteroidales bacterium]
MSYIKVIMILLGLAVASVRQYAQEISDSTACIPVRTVKDEELAFAHGESASFILHYEWGAINSDVGHADVRLDSITFNGRKAYKCTMHGRTTRLYDLFFKVREDFSSCFTRDGLVPLKFYRHSREGSYEAKNTYLYDRTSPEHKIVADLYTSKRGQHSVEIPLTPCTFDLPTLFYFARNMDFDVIEPGKKYPMTFAIDDEVFNVYFILYGRETIKVRGLGTVRTIRFAAKLLEGEVFKGETDMMIWVTDDDNRLPVYFEAPLLVGTAKGRMSSYENLKHPFTSLIKK